MKSELWQIRAEGKVGRPRLFSDPEQLWGAACEYFKWCDANPWIKTRTTEKGSGKDPGTDVTEEPTKRPYLMSGLLVYLGVSHSYFKMMRARAVDIDDEFVAVVDEIVKTIQTNQLDGAITKVYDGNLVARLQGLADKVENQSTIIITPTKKEIKNIANDLENGC